MILTNSNKVIYRYTLSDISSNIDVLISKRKIRKLSETKHSFSSEKYPDLSNEFNDIQSNSSSISSCSTVDEIES